MKSNVGESRDFLFVDQDEYEFQRREAKRIFFRRLFIMTASLLVSLTLMGVFYFTSDESPFDRDHQINDRVRDWDEMDYDSWSALHDAHLEERQLAYYTPSFVQFTRTYNKKYESGQHVEQALKNYAKQMERVKEMNRGLEVPQYGENEMSDWSDEEFANMLLPLDFYEKLRGDEEEFAQRMPKSMLRAMAKAPTYDHFDWRAFNAVTPVKAQGKCGSCWAFAATATVESAWLVKHPGDVRILSEQTLLDCDMSNDACNGGDDDKAFRFIHREGLAYLSDYPYVAHRQNSCLADSFKNRTKIEVSYAINPDEKSIIDWLVNFGPVNVGMSVTQPMRAWNSSEVFHPTKEDCRTKVIGLHALLIVGYGTSTKGEPYWIIKNSWGQSYGTEGGYINFYRGDNSCFIEDEPIGILAY